MIKERVSNTIKRYCNKNCKKHTTTFFNNTTLTHKFSKLKVKPKGSNLWMP